MPYRPLYVQVHTGQPSRECYSFGVIAVSAVGSAWISWLIVVAAVTAFGSQSCDPQVNVMPVQATTGKGGMELFKLSHSSGASAEVYSHGATVTSVKTAQGQELLFVSDAANFDGSSPIRGGIPVLTKPPPPLPSGHSALSFATPNVKCSCDVRARNEISRLERKIFVARWFSRNLVRAGTPRQTLRSSRRMGLPGGARGS